MKSNKNNLDERQEQKLLQIEHTAMWIAFFSLIAAIALQTIFCGENCFLYTTGEMAVLLIMSLYLAIATFKNNIWDRKMKPTFKNNLMMSLVAGVIVCVVEGFQGYNVSGGDIVVAISAGIAGFVLTAGTCLIILSILSKKYKKRVKAEEEKADEE